MVSDAVLFGAIAFRYLPEKMPSQIVGILMVSSIVAHDIGDIVVVFCRALSTVES
jgi:hypothetical protein